MRVARDLAGYTDYELARRAGVARNTVCRIERGEGMPRPETLQRLAVALSDWPIEDQSDVEGPMPSRRDTCVLPTGRP